MESLELTRRKRTKPENQPKPLVIKSFFKQHGVPNVRLAERLGVNEMCISRWLNGRVPIPDDKLAQLKEIVKEIKAWKV
ncbi:hypothetical protein D4S03_04325 [bacterium]|nr:MAG: hypothetical protein D4S03_04325 [bacterium]